MSTTTEQLKRAKTMEEVLQILKIPEYLPLFEKANILQASALTLLREADLKCIGIDNAGRQKLLRIIRCLTKNIPVTVGERIRQELLQNAVRVESKHYGIDEEEFLLQKAEDELLRCQVELNLKRNQLARIQKQAKLTCMILELAADTQQQVQKLRQKCASYGNSSIQQKATILAHVLSEMIIPCESSNLPKENVSTSSSSRNINSQGNIRRYQPQSAPRPFHDHSNRSYYVQHTKKTLSGPWYTKILKPIPNNNQNRQQNTGRAAQFVQHRSSAASHQPVLQFPVPQQCRGGGEKYRAATAPSSAPTSPRCEHSSFVDGFFSKFGKNKTSTPYKQPTKHRSNISGITQHHSFVYYSRKKVKNVFTRTPRREKLNGNNQPH